MPNLLGPQTGWKSGQLWTEKKALFAAEHPGSGFTLGKVEVIHVLDPVNGTRRCNLEMNRVNLLLKGNQWDGSLIWGES